MHNQLVAQAIGLPSADDIVKVQEARLKRAVIYLRVSTPRQARKNGEPEGYSLPAQREYCTRHAHELGATVVEEFVDAGESARTADRPNLQRLLTYIEENQVGYVIVHKLDRLARNTTDNAALLQAITLAGSQLESVTERFDDTNAGRFQRTVTAAMNEYYSANVATEAMKGMEQKARNGGTHGVAPIGYLNTFTRIEGVEIKGVMLDPERAEHITWAYRTYATGDVSITTLTDLLAERGLKSRKTRKYEGKALSTSQVHRLLKNPYYIGKIIYHGVVYDGAHDPLIDDDTWHQVQSLLSGRRLAGDRSWKHDHPLKGRLVCNRCGGRMGYGHSKGRGGVYSYFFCLGRHTGRTTCDLPYIPVDEVEQAMRREWDTRVQFTPKETTLARTTAHEILDSESSEAAKLAKTQRTRLRTLHAKKQRLIDAYLDGVIAAEDIRPRQDQVTAEIAAAERIIRASETDALIVRERVDTVIDLMSKAGDLYRSVSEHTKRLLNQVVFTSIRIDIIDEPDDREIALEAEYAPPVAAVAELARPAALAPNGRHTARRGRTARTSAQPTTVNRESKTPGKLSLTGGSNKYTLAEREGFEPSVSLPTTVFKTVTINHSVTSPCAVLGIF